MFEFIGNFSRGIFGKDEINKILTEISEKNAIIHDRREIICNLEKEIVGINEKLSELISINQYDKQRYMDLEIRNVIELKDYQTTTKNNGVRIDELTRERDDLRANLTASRLEADERLLSASIQTSAELQEREATILEREQRIIELEQAKDLLAAQMDQQAHRLTAQQDTIDTLHAQQQHQTKEMTVMTDMPTPEAPPLSPRDALNHDIVASMAVLDGWCTPQKAFLLADWIINNPVELAVEIGIFGGKSLVPMAQAMRFAGRGVIYGIEPWSNAIAVETATNEANDTWWGTVDLNGVKRRFMEHVVSRQLSDHIKVIELSSDEALAVFAGPRFAQKIDLVHIDGSHAEEQALRDVARWLPLMRPGGIIVLDDICWPSVIPALQYLRDTCNPIAEVRFGAAGADGALGEGFAAFRVRA